MSNLIQAIAVVPDLKIDETLSSNGLHNKLDSNKLGVKFNIFNVFIRKMK